MADEFPSMGFESNLISTFEEICKNACEVLGVDHSGFVRFDSSNSSGKVVAQYPALKGLIGRDVALKGVSAEEKLLGSDEPIVIYDVSRNTELGEVKPLLLVNDIQSICIVKVLFHEVVIGSFSFDSIGKMRRFSNEDIAFCRYLAQLASKIIENTQFWNWLEAFQKAIAAITSERESGSLLQTVIKQAEELFSVQMAGIYQRSLDGDGNEVLRHAASSVDDLENTSLRKGEGMAWQLILSDRPYETTTDYDQYPHRVRSYEGKFGSVLEVPLIRLNDRIGVVYLSDGKTRTFTEFDAKLLQRFADIVVIALQHCSLLDRMKELSIANADIARDFDSEKLEERLNEIAVRATSILNAEMCGVFLVEDSTIVLRASFGHRKNAFIPNQVFQIRDEERSGLTGAIAARLIKKHTENKETRDTLPPSDDFSEGNNSLVYNACGEELVADLSVKGNDDASPTGTCYSLLAIPLIISGDDGERISGILRVSNKKGADGVPRESLCFGDEDEWVLRIYAEAVVVAIESAKLFEKLTDQQELYGQLLATWNTLASDDTLESRLDSIAKNIVHITGKSFCRILLTEESEQFLNLKAAALRARGNHEEDLHWETRNNPRIHIADWPELKAAFQTGSPYELSLGSSQIASDTLLTLSRMLNINQGNGDEEQRISSIFSIPMMVGARPIGLLSIGELRSGLDRRRSVARIGTDVKLTPRGRDRRTISSVGFTLNQKNVATAIAAQATVMIDRDWRSQTIKRREELFSRLSKALDIIRAEPNSQKKLRVIPQQARIVLASAASGLIVQSVPDGLTKLIISSDNGLTETELDPDDQVVRELLSPHPLTGSNRAYSDKFGESLQNIAAVSDYHLETSLAVQFEFAARSRCLLFVGDDHNHSELTFSDFNVLEELANHCAISLTRAAMREQLTNARDGVNQIAIDLSLGDQMQALQNVVNGIATITGCDAVTLYTIRAADGEIKAPPATYGLTDIEKPAIYVKPVFESPVGRILERNELYCADDACDDEVMKGGFITRERITSCAGTPVWLPDEAKADILKIDSDGRPNQTRKAVGVLFANYRTPHAFTEDDKRSIQVAAHLAALAIRNHSLFTEERRKATILDSLYQASKALSRTLDLNVILKQLAEQTYLVAQTLDRKVTHAAIKLFEGGRAKIHAGYPLLHNLAVTVGEEFDLNPTDKRIGIVGRVFKNRKSEYVGNVLEDPDYRKVFQNTNSQIVILIGEENNPAVAPLGAITIESPDLYAFDENDLTAFRSLAALANNAIRNAQQFSDRQYALDREANLKDLALYYVKCGISIHNQKTPVLAIKRQAETLMGIAETGNLSNITSVVKGVVKSAEELEAISSEAETSVVQLISLRDFTESWKRLLKLKADLTTIPVVIAGPSDNVAKIAIDELLMRDVLKVFVDNSLQAMQGRPKKAIHIVVNHDKQGFCSISISDTGKGIKADEWEIIAAGKRPATADQARKGLRTALLIVTGFAGEIQLIKSSSSGTTFEIKIPLSERKNATLDP